MKKAIFLLIFALGSTMVFASNTDPKILFSNYGEKESNTIWLEEIVAQTENLASSSPATLAKEEAPCLICAICNTTLICVTCSCGDCGGAIDFLNDRLCALGCCTE